MTLHGPPTWTNLALSNLPVMIFAGAEYLECSNANTADLDFDGAGEDFSGMCWIYPTTLVGSNRTIISRWVNNTSGYIFYVDPTGILDFLTVQAGATQWTFSAAGAIVINAWSLVGWTLDGAAARVYKNGVDITSTAGVHVQPATSAALFRIGMDSAGAQGWIGDLKRPRMWSRALAAAEVKELYESERNLLGV
jgi:hypothetical protein